MVTADLKETFLSIVRLGIGNDLTVRKPEKIDWDALEALATQHGLSAILVDGVEKLPENQRPPRILLLQWIGESMRDYKCRYDQYRKAISNLAAFYNSHSYKMMVLKGFACSLDWPKPEHRPCGDIDIWLFGKQKEADAILTKEKGIEIDNRHHHHSVFYWHDFMVENHYDFVNVHHHKSNADFERILKRLGEDDSHSIELYDEKIYLPSPNLHALFLLKHLMIHFAAERTSIRQLLDWGFFVKAHGKEVEWTFVTSVLERFGLKELFDIFNAICVEDLGFDTMIFPRIQFSPLLKDRVVNEMLSPEFGEQLPKKLIPRVIFKFRRWTGNAWKHELCYKESMWSAFRSGVKNHLLKPSSI